MAAVGVEKQEVGSSLMRRCPECEVSHLIEKYRYRGRCNAVCWNCYRVRRNKYDVGQHEDKAFRKISRVMRMTDPAAASKVIDGLVVAYRGEAGVAARWRKVFDRLALAQQVDAIELLMNLEMRLGVLEAGRRDQETVHAVDIALGERLLDADPDEPRYGLTGDPESTKECRRCDRERPLDRFSLKWGGTRVRVCESCKRLLDRCQARRKAGKKLTERQVWRLEGMQIVACRRLCRSMIETFGTAADLAALWRASVDNLPTCQKLAHMMAFRQSLVEHAEQMARFAPEAE